MIKPVKVWKEGGGSVVHPGEAVNMGSRSRTAGDLEGPPTSTPTWDKKALSGRPSVDVKRVFNTRVITPGWTVTGTVTIFFGRRARQGGDHRPGLGQLRRRSSTSAAELASRHQYDGSAFRGWAKRDGGVDTVQGAA